MYCAYSAHDPCASPLSDGTQDYGGQINSIDEYDEMMDRWGELLEAGDTGGAIAMLEQRLPEMPEFDSNVGDYLASVIF